MYSRIILFVLVQTFLQSQLIAQNVYLGNPSFEGVPNEGICPPSWESCKEFSTPDTQPSFWEVDKLASEGQSYISLVGRGYDGFASYSTEALEAKIQAPISQNLCLYFRVDLAYFQEFYANGLGQEIYFDNPLKLNIWAGSSSCHFDTLIWQSPLINHAEWKTYHFSFNPENVNFNYLLLEAVFDSLPGYWGNILIDNLDITNDTETILIVDTLVSSGSQFGISAPIGTSFTWEPVNNLSCGNCQNPIITAYSNQTYICFITDSNNCSFEFIYQIQLNLTIPNVFTPNEDNFNELFTIKNLPDGSVVEIYNRWGLLMKRWRGNDRWNGRTEKGNEAPEGVYYCIVRLLNGKMETGFVHLIR